MERRQASNRARDWRNNNNKEGEEGRKEGGGGKKARIRRGIVYNTQAHNEGQAREVGGGY